MDWIISILAGGIGVSIITGLFKLIDSRLTNRINDNRDKSKILGERIEANADTIGMVISALKVILHDRIKYLSRGYISEGAIMYSDRRDLLDMYAIYHKLGGNGNIASLVRQVEELTVR